MKVKTLRFKETKEFVHVLQNGQLATSDIPDILANTASIENLQKYYETVFPEAVVDYDKLEVVEFDLVDLGDVQADIRNKLSPPLNLVEMLDEYFNNPEVPDFQKLEKLIQQEMKQTKVCVQYLSNFLIDAPEEED
jgi:hypothetical protein